jgi:hypothetical protein
MMHPAQRPRLRRRGTLATSMVLTEAIRKLAAQEELALIVCGRQTH